jgi:transposase
VSAPGLACVKTLDGKAWLADVLARINDHNIHRLGDLLPWNWAAETERRKVAA